ncbi:hypothetical protein PM082_023898 [Marasmius tenuissimus]|nr:hypothetical protein PM082_023898 [Marasmius tenuissimus]
MHSTLALLINLPYTLPDGTHITVKGRDPRLTEDELKNWLSHVPDSFWTRDRFKDVFEIPAVHKQPLRYITDSDRYYYAKGWENSKTQDTFNPFTFYEYCLKIRYSHDGRFLYSSATGRKLCFDRPFSTFKFTYDRLVDEGLSWTSPADLIRDVEEDIGLSFLDTDVFAYNLLNKLGIPYPHEFGALDNSWD